MARVNRVALRQNHRALDAVLQLTHVARPRIGLQLVDRRPERASALLVEIATELLDEVPRQDEDVITALAQRRNLDRKDGESK